MLNYFFCTTNQAFRYKGVGHCHIFEPQELEQIVGNGKGKIDKEIERKKQ